MRRRQKRSINETADCCPIFYTDRSKLELGGLGWFAVNLESKVGMPGLREDCDGLGWGNCWGKKSARGGSAG